MSQYTESIQIFPGIPRHITRQRRLLRVAVSYFWFLLLFSAVESFVSLQYGAGLFDGAVRLRICLWSLLGVVVGGFMCIADFGGE